jgi:hypothetical protein
VQNKRYPKLIDTREQLLHLLAEAAEFEHNLLCCYLYAAFSMKRGGGEGLTDEQVAAVKSWHKIIMSVAIEEMSHLALVANLTVAIGGRPHFNRPNFPVAPGYHPADIVVKLAPFDMDTLDHFIFLERPHGVPVADGEGFEAEHSVERGLRPGAALMPGAHDYETIAEFYASIRDGFIAAARVLGESALFTGNPAMQIGPDVISMPGLHVITDLRSACEAIDTIVVQGEGAASDAEDSHFARFTQVKEEFAAILSSKPSFTPARPAAKNVVMRAPEDPEDRVHVDEPHAAAVLDLANALYNHMLRLLSQAYGRAAPAVKDQRMLVEGAMQLMHALAAVGEHLTTLPASLAAPGVNAGMTFTTLRATEPLVEGSGEWAVLAERFGELATAMRAMCREVPALEGVARDVERLAESFSGEASARAARAH